MGMSRADYLSQLQALLPPGMAWTRDPNAVLTRLLDGFSEEFSRVNLRSMQLIDESDPLFSNELLTDFERVLGLPDTCCSTDSATTISARRARVAEKYYSSGGQSRQFFIDLAARLGYTDVSISEFRPMTCEDPCDRPVYGEDWRFAWQMNIGDYFAIHSMTCEDPCDSPLRSWQQNELLCRVNQLKPAHTIALINWTMTQEQIDVVVAYGRDDVQAGAPALHALLNTTLPSASYW